MRLRSRWLWWTALLIMLFVPTSAWRGDASETPGLRVTVREPRPSPSAARRSPPRQALASTRAAFSTESGQLHDGAQKPEAKPRQRNPARRGRRSRIENPDLGVR